MGRLLKKNQEGTVKKYISRNQALKLLQISLTAFKRLCILKGIYPRDPPHKSKLSNGSSAKDKTYYYVRDIKNLVNDPTLASMRKLKTFYKKIKRLQTRGEWKVAKRFATLNRPKLPMADIIKSRYPTFLDAIRDLDDALTHISLFSSLPLNAINCLDPEIIGSSYRLLGEFCQYVMAKHALRLVFISIKGAYLQAEIHGELVTWLLPHAFTLEIPQDVDIRIMATFLEVYHSLLSFVNFKLLKEIGWGYPAMENPPTTSWGIMAISNPDPTPIDLASAVPNCITSNIEEVIDNFTESAEVPSSVPPSNEINSIFSSIVQKDAEQKAFSTLFSRLVFFLSREVPFDLLVLCIASFGGRVGWNHGPGSPFTEDDTRITHHIVDRPIIQHMFGGRKYIQPQWVFDSINTKRLLSEELYGPTVKSLPPHLSPFVKEEVEEESNEPPVDEGINDADQAHELALSMMSKKKRKLYEAMQRGINKKKAEKTRLASRRRKLAATASTTAVTEAALSHS